MKHSGLCWVHFRAPAERFEELRWVPWPFFHKGESPARAAGGGLSRQWREQGLLCNHLLKWWGTSSFQPGHSPAWIIPHWRESAESRALPTSVLLSPEYPRLAPLLANGIYTAYASLPSVIHTALLLHPENIHGLSKLSLYIVWGVWLLSFIFYSSVSFSFSFPKTGAPDQVLMKSMRVTNS